MGQRERSVDYRDARERSVDSWESQTAELHNRGSRVRGMIAAYETLIGVRVQSTEGANAIIVSGQTDDANGPTVTLSVEGVAGAIQVKVADLEPMMLAAGNPAELVRTKLSTFTQVFDVSTPPRPFRSRARH